MDMMRSCNKCGQTMEWSGKVRHFTTLMTSKMMQRGLPYRSEYSGKNGHLGGKVKRINAESEEDEES